ncbi:MAG: hypothetical protein D6719_10635 [Candidatus Dadabacteria bacterium]|nr:MAG: hypothetical protein D6719_10635 [Candidatus Dadabacteria bacterium]
MVRAGAGAFWRCLPDTSLKGSFIRCVSRKPAALIGEESFERSKGYNIFPKDLSVVYIYDPTVPPCEA